jgi:ADP-ribose pyrophosphatase YjhB (NUDIX family)
MSNELKTKRNQVADEDTAAVAVIVRNGKILLVLREYEKAPTVWTVPGGSSDGGEKLEVIVRRETQEETGIDNLEFVDYIGEVNADDRDPLHIFHCHTDQNPKLKEPQKFSEWRWFSLSDFADGKPDNYINEPLRNVILDYLKSADNI